MKKLFRGSKGRTQPEDEDQNRDALFGSRTAATPPPPGDGYGSNSNPYAPERGGGRDGYGAPQGGYGRSNNEIGNRGGYGGASNPYALHNGGDNGGHNSSGEPDRAQLFGARQQKHDYSYTAHANEPSARDDDEDTELVKQEIKDTNRKTAGLTESALAAARRAEASGIATIERLGMQGERLSNTEKNLDVASVQNRIAEDKARELKQYNRSMFVPAMGNPLRSSARAKEEEARILAHHQNDRDERERTREFGYEGRNTVGRALNDATRRVESKATTGLAERSRYQFEADESDDEKEKVIANNLDELGAITGRLKGLAMATSKEVDRQNVQIERIMKKSDRVDDQIAINHNRIRKIH
ncbi:hypothetical protein HOY82DRAFT_581695 [Tuber indicum]|nr:hypothetical protein HOY82DRAFT_581695 [Tuber indicum]